LWLADEGVSGAVPPESRKRFKAALALLEAGEPEALIFTKVDHASRCTEDFARLLRISEEQSWRLIVTELGIDTRAPMGKAMAHMAVVFAELERDLIRSRTREALAVRREHGVDLGRPRSTPDDVVARVVRERLDGRTAYAIARDLNKDAVPTAQGAPAWSQATVRALLMREGVTAIAVGQGVPGSDTNIGLRAS
jgi:DNA invertase Pin-like site-specific DNA recombinase